MPNETMTPALNDAEWKEWRQYKAELAQTQADPIRAARQALQTMARNNDLLPDASPYKITHVTVFDLRAAADCLETQGETKRAETTRVIASMLEASLGPP